MIFYLIHTYLIKKFKYKVNDTKAVNCTHKYHCEGPNSNATLTILPECGKNAICGIDSNNNPICICIDGYNGDGFTCTGN